MTAANFQISLSSSLKEQLEDDSGYQGKSAMLTSNKITLPSLISKTENSNSEMKSFKLNMERLLVKHTSHALCYVSEHQRIESVIHIDSMTHTASLLQPTFIDDYKRSIQTGAPAIGFLDQKLHHRNSSHSAFVLKNDKMESEPLVESSSLYRIKNNAKTVPEGRITQNRLIQQAVLESNISGIPLSQCLTKRVSWLSMKNLQEKELSIRTIAANKRNCRQLAMSDLHNEIFSRNGSRINKQFDSVFQLDYTSLLNKKTDTPPLETLSWSNADIALRIFMEFWMDTVVTSKSC
ncbi:hypothetical protein DINM_005096 [Dirofilaria immitis]|nr:hypothetical protein [Dirofilaria immitis]